MGSQVGGAEGIQKVAWTLSVVPTNVSALGRWVKRQWQIHKKGNPIC